MVVGGCRSLVAEHWRLKPARGPGFDSRRYHFSFFPFAFQRSSDTNGPDNLKWSSDLGEPRLSGSLCCDEAQILSKSQTHTAIIITYHILTYISTNPLMCIGPNKSIVLDYLVQYLYSQSFILLMAIVSGPGRFTITGVSIGVDRDPINVTYMKVSRVTIYSYWLCMTL